MEDSSIVFKRRPKRCLSAVALLLIFSLTGEELAFADSKGGETSFRSFFRPDRASGRFRAFLEIHHGARSMRIIEITPQGPADQAGLKVGDVIVAMDGMPLPDWDDDLERIKDQDHLYSAGDVVELEFRRFEAHSAQEPALHETFLTFEAMPRERQEELWRWIAIAEQRLAEGEALYCHDVRPSQSGTHYLCHDDDPDPTGKSP